ncbi:MAG TPA: VOC family protein [Kiritimatiellia bacterium]|nr:VOC family protein [Kiritimatiellia bacterium]
MKSGHGLLRLKVLALAVRDSARAHRFYGELLGLEPAYEGTEHVGYVLGDVILMLKPDWLQPTAQPNFRATLASADAHATAAWLRTHGVTIADEVQQYDAFWVGSFLDPEGNKLYFCSPVNADP